MSFGLTKQEVLDYWGLSYEKLPENDKWFFDVNFAKGRSQAKRIAVDRLFTTMKLSNAKDSCMAYLVRFSDNWDDGVDDKASGRKYILELS